MAKDAYYFSHDYNARTDERIMELRSMYGMEGYGVYWCVIEIMAENNGYFDTSLWGGHSIAIGVAKDRLMAIVGNCIQLGLFHKVEDGKMIYSGRLSEHLELRKTLSESGKKGAEARKSKGGYGPPNAKERKGKEILKESKGNINYNGVVLDLPMAFDEFARQYKKIAGRTDARSIFLETIITQEKWDKLLYRLNNYKKTETYQKGDVKFILNMDKFLDKQQDYDAPEKPIIANTSDNKKFVVLECGNCHEDFRTDVQVPYCDKCDKLIKEAV